MLIQLKAFGPAKDFVQTNQTIELEVPCTVKELKTMIGKLNPDIQQLHYAIAIDNEIVHDEYKIELDCTAFILPPFTGG